MKRSSIVLHAPWCIMGLVLLFSGLALTWPKPGLTGEKTTHLGMTFIRVQPGTFTMGSQAMERFRDPDEHLHQVRIPRAFYLQETEVTLGHWRAVMGTGWFSRRKGEDHLPVTEVSWHDCIRFINKLNARGQGVFRLPTEAEWEYACRAGTSTAYSWGDAIDCAKAMYGNNPRKDDECIPFYQTLGIAPDRPAPVKSFPPNPWGFFDMHGNVWEWCQDAYSEALTRTDAGEYSGVVSESRVRRGGSWYKHAQYLRSANRTYAHPGAKFKTTGFRLVREAD